MNNILIVLLFCCAVVAGQEPASQPTKQFQDESVLSVEIVKSGFNLERGSVVYKSNNRVLLTRQEIPIIQCRVTNISRQWYDLVLFDVVGASRNIAIVDLAPDVSVTINIRGRPRKVKMT